MSSAKMGYSGGTLITRATTGSNGAYRFGSVRSGSYT